jgi:hypothetical protein
MNVSNSLGADQKNIKERNIPFATHEKRREMNIK